MAEVCWQTSELYLNPAAGQGKAVLRWEALKAQLKSLARSNAHAQSVSQLQPALGTLLHANPRVISDSMDEESERVSSRGATLVLGGDGTLHHVLNRFAALGTLDGRTVGMVGLGSSCDFLKWGKGPADTLHPLAKKLRLNVLQQEELRPYLVTLIDAQGQTRDVLAFLTVSVGLSAEANHRFTTSQSPIVRWARAASVDLAAGLVAWQSLVRGTRVSVEYSGETPDGKEKRGHWLTHQLSILRTPYAGGAFRYPHRHAPCEPILDVWRTRPSHSSGLLSVFIQLLCGRAPHESKVEYQAMRSFSCQFPGVTRVELDGEIYEAMAIQVRPADVVIRVLGRGWDGGALP